MQTLFPSKNARAFFALVLTVFAVGPAATARAAQTYEPYYFTTFAGDAGYGSADGTGSAGRFRGPASVAADSDGNVYVADSLNNTIRKITPAGVVTTLAGLAGNAGSADGTGSAARFSAPGGIAVDSGKNVYVADTNNSTIRKITPAGVVTTLAGLAGTIGSVDGSASAARFNKPRGTAVDSAGNVYVADTANHTIRKISSAGAVTTLAGLAANVGSVDDAGSAARFRSPRGVAVDGAGNVYVADTSNYTIRKITSAGVVTTFAGLAGSFGSADGTGSAARFFAPNGVTVDSAGNVYVADTANCTIRKITPGAVVTTLAGSSSGAGPDDGTGSAARFRNPGGVTVDSAGNVFVADTDNSTIRKITPAGVVTTLAGFAGSAGGANGTGSAAGFSFPSGVAIDNAGNLYVADTDAHTIRKITPAGVVTTLAGLAGTAGTADGTGSAARFFAPAGVAVDSAGNVYVAEGFPPSGGNFGNHTIRKITPAGVVTTLAGSAGNAGSIDGTGSAARFQYPSGVAVDISGNVYVADSGNHTIRKITAAGVVTTVAGLAGSSGNADGTGSLARFLSPRGVAVDGAGNLYVADTDSHTIRKITSAGVVTTLAGLAGNSGNADGTGSDARFLKPRGVTVDSAGNLYVADTDNYTIRKITSAAAVTTLAGSPRVFGDADGTGSVARFVSPGSVAVGSGGTLYVADSGNSIIRKGVPAVAPAITSGSSASFVLGSNSSFTVTSTGTPVAALSVAGTLPVGVTFVDNGNGTATIAGTPASGSTGSYLLTITAANGAPPDGTQTFTLTVSKRTQTIAFSAVPNKTYGDPDFTPSATASSGLPVTFSIVSGPAIISGNKVHLTGPGTVVVRAAQAGNIDYLAALSVDQSITVAKGTQPLNISTRMEVLSGDNVLIAGFIITGPTNSTKRVMIRGLGPSLGQQGVPNALTDPLLELHGPNDLVITNDSWEQAPNASEIPNGFQPSDAREAVVIATLTVGPDGFSSYTAIVRGANGETGIGLVEAYDLTHGPNQFANISTRGFIDSGNNVMIGGFILGGTQYSSKVLIRAIGPSLPVSGKLADPTLEIHNGSGTTIATNDNWKVDDATGGSQEAAIAGTTIPPSNDQESAVLVTLPPGAYTAIVAGKDGTTGVGLIEVYNLP